jgi:hypothetical protein
MNLWYFAILAPLNVGSPKIVCNQHLRPIGGLNVEADKDSETMTVGREISSAEKVRFWHVRVHVHQHQTFYI